MALEIHAIQLGVTNCYLIRHAGTILVDCGMPRKVGKLARSLKKLAIDPEEIKFAFITHGHFDHKGSTKEISELTRAKIVMHRRDRQWLQEGVAKMPGGVTTWGKVLHRTLQVMLLPFVKGSPHAPDVTLDDNELLSLEEYGHRGQVLHTPGHSPGSISLLLDSGEAFVGDLAMNGIPFCTKPSLPIFADDQELVKKSWRILLDRGARMIYPGHGAPLPADAMRPLL